MTKIQRQIHITPKKYTNGPFSIGYSQAFKALLLADNIAATAIEGYEQTNYSIAYAASR